METGTLSERTGRCLCGDVRVRVAAELTEISGCHCDNCRRWGGGVQFGISVPAEKVTIDGPVKVHRSSRIAERGWCDTCGSAVFLRDVDGEWNGYLELSPGLFDDAGGARLVRIVYADSAVGGIELAGPHARVSKSDYEAVHPHLEQEVEDDQV